MKSYSAQRGFVMLEAILAIVAVAAIGAAGYFAYQNHVKKTDSSAKPKSPVAVADAYAGWNTYNSQLYDFSLRYPKDWKIQASVNDPAAAAGDSTTGASKEESVELDGPNNFVLNLDTPAGLGGGCDQQETIHTVSSTKVSYTGPDNSPIYLIERSAGQGSNAQRYLGLAGTSDGQTLRFGDFSGCPPVDYLIFTAHHAAATAEASQVVVSGEYSDPSTNNTLSDAAFFKAPEVQTAVKILASIRQQ